MNFIAFLVGLGFERLFASRGPRGQGSLLAYVRAVLGSAGARPALVLGVAILAVLLPAALVTLVLGLPPVVAHPALRVLIAALVLFFALGPRDLDADIGAYRAALAHGDAAAAARLAEEILEHDAGQRQGPTLNTVAEAVFVQANNRLFGVLFWFALAGPAGALVFRLTDLVRREAIARARPADAPSAAAERRRLCQSLHGVLAFVPARLLALSYGVAGSFEESFTGWRGYLKDESDHFFDANDHLLLFAGKGALGARWEGAAGEGERAAAARGLVRAAFYVWLAVFALLTAAAWIS